METSGKYHVVAQGECLSSITKLYDYSDHQIIYNHPNNVELKRQRPNPNVLYPGDKLFIPNKECKKVPAATGKRHKYVRHRPKVMLRLVVKDENWEPFLGRHYQLKFNTLAKPYSGTTSASDGKIEHPQAGEPEIGSDVEEGELTVWLSDDSSQPPAVWKLKLGHLDPVEELTGVQKRLANLGFPTGEPDGELNEPTKGALAAFPTLAGQEASADNDQ
ncbi:MAG: PGRP and LysM peptidoglycan-binding domain-containing protein, partial [Pyrinomonadaceae bacterium]